MSIVVAKDLPYEPWWYVQNNQPFGILVDMLRNICAPNCSFKVSHFGQCYYDITMQNVDVCLGPFLAMGHSGYPYLPSYAFHDVLTLSGENQELESTLEKRLLSMDKLVWIGLVISAILLALFIGTFWDALWQFFGFLFAEPFTWKGIGTSKRILLASWMITVTVVVAAFTGILKADLVYTPPRNRIDSWEDMKREMNRTNVHGARAFSNDQYLVFTPSERYFDDHPFKTL